MEKTHWKKLQNTDYLGAYSLDNGAGGYTDAVFTIASVRQELVVGADGKKEPCVVARFSEPNTKPMILNRTNSKTLEKVFKTPYLEDWAGRKVQIGVEAVKAFGEVVDALRIRPFVPRDPEAKCVGCGKKISATDKMSVAQLVAFGNKRYGKALCAACLRPLVEAAKPDAEKEGAHADTEQQ